MVNDKILEFYKEFQDEVLTYVKENSPISTNTAFKTLFLSYLVFVLPDRSWRNARFRLYADGF